MDIHTAKADGFLIASHSLPSGRNRSRFHSQCARDYESHALGHAQTTTTLSSSNDDGAHLEKITKRRMGMPRQDAFFEHSTCMSTTHRGPLMIARWHARSPRLSSSSALTRRREEQDVGGRGNGRSAKRQRSGTGAGAASSSGRWGSGSAGMGTGLGIYLATPEPSDAETESDDDDDDINVGNLMHLAPVYPRGQGVISANGLITPNASFGSDLATATADSDLKPLDSARTRYATGNSGRNPRSLSISTTFSRSSIWWSDRTTRGHA